MDSNQLKIALMQRRKTVRELAEYLGYSTANLYGKMSGKVNVTLGEVKQITDYLHLSDDEMMAIFFEEKFEETQI